MKKFLTLISILILVPLSLYSMDQEIFSLDNDIYDYIDYLYIIDHKVPPTAAKPYSIGQLKLYLSQIDYNELNAAGKNYYSYINKIINQNNLDIKLDDKASMDVEALSGFEVYTHTNTVDIKTHRDWVYEQEDRLPLLKLNLKLAMDDLFFTSCDLQYSQGKYEPSSEDQYYYTGTELYDNLAPYGIGTLPETAIKYNILTNQYNQSTGTNIPLASKYIDFDTPKRAIFSVGGDNWNFNFSKDKLEWGNSTIGNFIYDDHIKNNFINLKIFSNNFNINNTIALLNTQINGGESPDIKVKMFLTHRIEFRPTEFFRFAISENVMYQNDTLIPLYFNPSYIYHNINMRGMFNAIASLESDILLTNKLSWYSQFVLDQARAPNEDDSQSGAWGFSSGLKYVSTINDTDLLNISAEALLATPCLYRRDAVDFITFDRTFVINQSYVIAPTFIGFKEGGDSVAFKLQTTYTRLNKFDFSLYYYLLLKGEMNIFMASTVDNAGNPISNDDRPNYGSEIFKNGIFSIKHIVNGTLNYQIYKNNYFEVSNRNTLSYIYMDVLQTSDVNPTSYSDIQFSSGISIKF